MSRFMHSIARKANTDLQGEVFEFLDTIGDFNAFKEMMLAQKAQKDGSLPNLSDLLVVTPLLK